MAIVVIVGIAVLGYVLRVVLLIAAGMDLATEIAYDQIAAGAIAVALAVVFGQYAVQHVELARVAIDQDRLARGKAQTTEAKRTLMALLNEMNYTRFVALCCEGRLRVAIPHAEQVARLPFKRTTLDALTAGPMWGSERTTKVRPAITFAYWQMNLLKAELQLLSQI